MAVAFSTSEEAVQRAVESPRSSCPDADVEEFFEVHRCCTWIITGGYTKVALQFPDDHLCHSAVVAEHLQTATAAEVIILADTSYGSCCVDEVSALHYDCDAVIHFGHACLSPSERLPVLYIFGKAAIDVHRCCECLVTEHPETVKLVLLICAVEYLHAKAQLYERLSQHYTQISALDTGSNTVPSDTSTDNAQGGDRSVFSIYGEKLTIPDVNNCVVFYVGGSSVFVTNILIQHKDIDFCSFNPADNCCWKHNLSIGKLLMKRYYLIEKVKDAKVVGILIGTLSVKQYLEIVKRLKKLLTYAGKKYYVISVGKINVAKLANFPDIELYVQVSCPESVILECTEFYRPIVTPFEVELACDPDRQWSGKISMDFSSILPGGADYQAVNFSHPVQTVDVSLVTGRIRELGLSVQEQPAASSNQLARRDNMEISTVSGEKFQGHSWHGLDPALGKTPVTKAVQGRKGIAIQYEEEPTALLDSNK